MRVKRIDFNWFSTHENGEEFTYYEVGKEEVSEIQENEPHNGMQLWNYIVKFKDGKTVRIFNPNYVEYFKKE